MEIYCPECGWEPPASARWTCECGHSWHTFDTQGQCPECGKVWRETQCHECHAWSPHHDWYHDLPPVDLDAVAEEQGASARLACRGGISPQRASCSRDSLHVQR